MNGSPPLFDLDESTKAMCWLPNLSMRAVAYLTELGPEASSAPTRLTTCRYISPFLGSHEGVFDDGMGTSFDEGSRKYCKNFGCVVRVDRLPKRSRPSGGLNGNSADVLEVGGE